MNIKIQCDCCTQLRTINAKVKLEEEINDQIMTMIVTPCPNCLASSYQGGYEAAMEETKKEKEELKEKIEKVKDIKELEQLMLNFWENDNV